MLVCNYDIWGMPEVNTNRLLIWRNYLQGDLLEKLTQDNMTKVMNMMAEEAEKGPIELKSHLNNIVFYQLYTLCFGEKCVYTTANWIWE